MYVLALFSLWNKLGMWSCQVLPSFWEMKVVNLQTARRLSFSCLLNTSCLDLCSLLIHLNGRSSPCGVHQKCSWIFVQLTQGCWFFSRGSGPTPFLHNCLVSQCSISLQSMCAPWSNSNWALPSLSSCSWPRSCTVGTSAAWSICCYGMYTLIYDFMVFV